MRNTTLTYKSPLHCSESSLSGLTLSIKAGIVYLFISGPETQGERAVEDSEPQSPG